MGVLVNGERVDDGEIEAEFRLIREPLAAEMRGQTPSEVEARAWDWARENVIERVLLRQAGEAGGGLQQTIDAVQASAKTPGRREGCRFLQREPR